MIRVINLLILFTSIVTIAQGQSSDSKFEQTDKGSHLAGGTISFNNSFANKSNSFSANLNPNYGYFLANNLAVGGLLSLTYSSSSLDKSHSTMATLSPFVRYYFGPPKTYMFFGYASAGGGIQSSNSTTSSNNGGSSSNNARYGISTFQVGPGFDYFVNKHVAVEAILSYRGTNVAQVGHGGIYNNNVGLLIGLQVFF
ncbi:MAG TPA: outer membrane beta-barrel protein [Cytophagaceae bacterium]|jgi:hypothetical protein|nr:outer membrane beta-barrel protein [Cytophagaceae bacterium]